MEQYIYDETNGLWYERDGDYYIPCLKLPETNIGIWGERYLTYIREHKKLLHTKLMINGTLYDHLAEINKQAEEMFSELVNQMKTNEGITEVPFGAVMELEFVKNKRGVIHLRRATVLG